MDVMISAIRRVAEEVLSLELTLPDGEDLPPFDAGAHIDVHLPGELTRQYSLCNAPTERHRYCIAVLRAASSRGGSRAVHEQLRVGHIIQINTPRNLFPLAHSAQRSLLFAGGIGITPLLSMAQDLAQRGQAFELHYCARTASKAAFTQRLKHSALADRVHFHFSDGPVEQKLDMAAALAGADEGCHLYACGPSGFMDHVQDCARDRGWPETRLHREHFSAAPTLRADDGSFDVLIRSSGMVVNVPADKSVVRALDEAGVFVAVSCEQGLCGTCITGVLEGEPDHRDCFFSDAERASNDKFTPCCSRAKSALLVLDL